MTRRSMFTLFGAPMLVDERAPKGPVLADVVQFDQWAAVMREHAEAVRLNAVGGMRYHGRVPFNGYSEPIAGPTLPWIREVLRRKRELGADVAKAEITDYFTGRKIPPAEWMPE